MMRYLYGCLLALALNTGLGHAVALPAESSRPNAIPAYRFDERDWGVCDYTHMLVPHLHCATLEVPMDWDTGSAYAGRKVKLHISRLLPTLVNTPEVLFFDAGTVDGGGAQSCIDQTVHHNFLSGRLLGNLTIICVDRRGVGKSTPAVCNSTLFNEIQTWFPADEQGFNALNDASKQFADSCMHGTGPELAFTDATTAARDWEAVRVALNLNSRINIFAQYNGASIATRYLELFPDRVRTMVLDSPVDHSLSQSEMLRTASMANEAGILRFLDFCNRADSFCPWRDTWGAPAPAINTFDELMTSSNPRPLQALECLPQYMTNLTDIGRCRTSVSGYQMIETLMKMLANPTKGNWETATTAVWHALQKNAVYLSPFLAEDHDWRFGDIAAYCAEWGSSGLTWDQHRALQTIARQAAPHSLGNSVIMRAITLCMNWPYRPRYPPRPLDTAHLRRTFLGDVVILAGPHNPWASWLWGRNLQLQIPRSVLVNRTGDGHPEYFWSEDARDLVDDYLISRHIQDRRQVP